MLGDRKRTTDSSINRVVKDRGNCTIGIASIWVRNTKSGSSCLWLQLVRLLDSFMMKFRQLLAFCYHYLVSDQDFKKCCDEVAIFKLECTCLPEMIVLQCLRH